MREIKFRVWYKEENVFIDFTKMGFDDVGNLWYVQEIDEFEKELDPPHFIDNEEIVIMQYTGLKEGLKGIDGKEIYEGDVVKGHWWKDGKKHRHIGRVAYVMNAFMVRGVKQYRGFDDELNPTYEVIGNIYEHPHLIKEEN